MKEYECCRFTPIEPIEYSRLLRKVMQRTNFSIEELAIRLDKTPEWISEKLNQIIHEIPESTNP